MATKMIKRKVVKTMSVKEYIAAHPDMKLDRNKVYTLIKDGKLTAHKGAKGAWVISEEVEVETISNTNDGPRKDKKRMPSKKTSKTYSTKEFLEAYNKKHPKTPLTIAELRVMLMNGKVFGEKINGKWVIYQSPIRRAN